MMYVDAAIVMKWRTARNYLKREAILLSCTSLRLSSVR